MYRFEPVQLYPFLSEPWTEPKVQFRYIMNFELNFPELDQSSGSNLGSELNSGSTNRH